LLESLDLLGEHCHMTIPVAQASASHEWRARRGPAAGSAPGGRAGGRAGSRGAPGSPGAG